MRVKLSFLLLFFTSILFSQEEAIEYYIKPYIGLEFLASNFNDRKQRPAIIKRTTFPMTNQYGLNLLIDVKHHFAVELGYGAGDIGYAIYYRWPNSLDNGVEGSKTRVRRWTLNFIKPINFLTLKRKHKKNLNLFEIGFVIGVSREYIPMYGEGNITFPSNNGSSSLISETSLTLLRQNSWGANLGLNFQFYQKSKRHVELGLVYHQGVRKRWVATWETNTGESFSTYTRGSNISLYISYPIALFKIRNK